MLIHYCSALTFNSAQHPHTPFACCITTTTTTNYLLKVSNWRQQSVLCQMLDYSFLPEFWNLFFLWQLGLIGLMDRIDSLHRPTLFFPKKQNAVYKSRGFKLGFVKIGTPHQEDLYILALWPQIARINTITTIRESHACLFDFWESVQMPNSYSQHNHTVCRHRFFDSFESQGQTKEEVKLVQSHQWSCVVWIDQMKLRPIVKYGPLISLVLYIIISAKLWAEIWLDTELNFLGDSSEVSKRAWITSAG